MYVNRNHLSEVVKHLIKSCIAGDRTAQAKLYQLYAAKMLGVCSWYAANKQEAEETLHDGFMRVFTYMHKYSGRGSFEGWIRKIMVNAALSRYKRNSHLRLVVEYRADAHDIEDDTSFIEVLDSKDLVRLIQKLSPCYRMVFNLYVMEGMKHREIAEILGISEGTSKSNLADARAILQKSLTVKKKVATI